MTDNWMRDCGIDGYTAPHLFRSAEEIDAVLPQPPQAHALRRAFAELNLDAILCIGNTPAAYFKHFDARPSPNVVTDLHRRAWNHGLAVILLVIDPLEVQILSTLSLPTNDARVLDDGVRIVETLKRAAQAVEIQNAILGIESGEFFRLNVQSFNPACRVDHYLLANLGEARRAIVKVLDKSQQKFADALLCRVIFTCYLIDRKIIDRDYFDSLDVPGCSSLIDLLSPKSPDRRNRTAHARLYDLFAKLQEDFNGDLFGDGLAREREAIESGHVDIIYSFLTGATIASGQLALPFWAYDFSIIPIETISAIYEDFLKGDEGNSSQRATGSYYTPRFLAEITLDAALDGLPDVSTLRYCDPACGSGIFLVGIFHRLAEAWRRSFPKAGYDEHVDALVEILQTRIFGIDRNPVACRIAAFSLYVALLDQLDPPAIQRLKQRRRLPPIVFSSSPDAILAGYKGKTILHSDFAEADAHLPVDGFDVIVGNPPWVSRGRSESSEETDGDAAIPDEAQQDSEPPALLAWCKKAGFETPQDQIAYGFVWKSTRHLKGDGRVCFLLPHSMLFHGESAPAVAAQRRWFTNFPPDRIVNLSDLRFVLFSGAIKPCLIVRFGNRASRTGIVEYFVPKADPAVLKADLLTIAPQDRVQVRLGKVLEPLTEGRVPQVWKFAFWGSSRDQRLLERLADLPRLSAYTDSARERRQKMRTQQPFKRWLCGQGFQPLSDADRIKVKRGELTVRPAFEKDTLFVDASSVDFDLILREGDVSGDASRFGDLRRRPELEEIFEPPHILIKHGMSIAYAGFPCVFRHSIHAINGPQGDSPLLMFLAAYLRSPLARYWSFHALMNFGLERPKMHLEELLAVPFFPPEEGRRPESARSAVKEVAKIMRSLVDSKHILQSPGDAIHEEVNHHVYEYFGISRAERILIEDTVGLYIPSATPHRSGLSRTVTLQPTSSAELAGYSKQVGDTLSSWVDHTDWSFSACAERVSGNGGVVVAIVERFRKGAPRPVGVQLPSDASETLRVAMNSLSAHRGSLHLNRGVKLFLDGRLILVKPDQKRFWTRSEALNDADGIASAALSTGEPE